MKWNLKQIDRAEKTSTDSAAMTNVDAQKYQYSGLRLTTSHFSVKRKRGMLAGVGCYAESQGE